MYVCGSDKNAWLAMTSEVWSCLTVFAGGTTRGSGHTAVSTYDTDEVTRPHGSNGGAGGGTLASNGGGGPGSRVTQNGGRSNSSNGRAPYNEKTMLLSSDDEFQWGYE